MNQFDSLGVALGATMALILASRAVQAKGLSFRTKAVMALAWLCLIVAVAFIATWWP
ncbi:MAG: hypothetical protein M3N34_02870 [Pseudomonadota bacterium]|nr:hypothetical protein [Pseudomonadota bacterium]